MLESFSCLFILFNIHPQPVSAVPVPGVTDAPIPVDATSPCVEPVAPPVGEGEVKEKPELPG